MHFKRIAAPVEASVSVGVHGSGREIVNFLPGADAARWMHLDLNALASVGGPIPAQRHSIEETQTPALEGPSASALVAIEAEWPVIAAELDLVDAECRLAASAMDVLAGRAYRRAVRRLLAVLAAAGPAPVLASGVSPVAA